MASTRQRKLAGVILSTAVTLISHICSMSLSSHSLAMFRNLRLSFLSAQHFSGLACRPMQLYRGKRYLTTVVTNNG